MNVPSLSLLQEFELPNKRLLVLASSPPTADPHARCAGDGAGRSAAPGRAPEDEGPASARQRCAIHTLGLSLSLCIESMKMISHLLDVMRLALSLALSLRVHGDGL